MEISEHIMTYYYIELWALVPFCGGILCTSTKQAKIVDWPNSSRRRHPPDIDQVVWIAVSTAHHIQELISLPDPMASIRPMMLDDLLHFNVLCSESKMVRFEIQQGTCLLNMAESKSFKAVNLDTFTETFNMNFYFNYLTRWPECCAVPRQTILCWLQELSLTCKHRRCDP